MITFFDITIFAIITLFSFFGLYQGIIGFATRTLGFITSIMLGYFLYPYISDLIGKYMDNEVIRIIIAGVISYVIALILCVFIVYKFLAIISFMRNGFIDRFLGLLAGFAVGTTISLVLFFITMIFTSENYFKSKSLKDFVVSSKQSKYGGVLKVAVTTDYLDELSKNIIVIIPNETLKSIEIFENKDLNNFKNSLKKSNDSNDDEDVFSRELQDELSNIDDE
ncbi:colicin V production family protein [Rickettsia parkeri str. Tate's Hell]|uniref:Colicin V production family protein n=1 Tax=Rickettsia parkeri str. Tate's Hell TaxID=1359189 RepID=A0ABR5DQT8_RICPA|nr:CvpA family protein [Rickettsia parkeri]AFC74248.1 Putative colicin V production membrane protein [Rickettsia parkeri str. Portsmouth]KJV94615.1 colicin V production family protein [Rickettsia parkeri str. Grand Bay]KJV95851.1 colicin V production family protein [Rickettsia parkeri str. AT\